MNHLLSREYKVSDTSPFVDEDHIIRSSLTSVRAETAVLRTNRKRLLYLAISVSLIDMAGELYRRTVPF
jgi:hypothetical protein